MKRFSLIAALAAGLLASHAAQAATYFYPSKEDAWFSFELPETWHPKIAAEFLEAAAPDDGAFVNFWILADKADFKIRDKELGEILKDSVTDAKMFGVPTKKVIRGIEFHTFLAMGKNRDDKTPVSFEVWMFSPKPGKIGFFYFVRDTENGNALSTLKKLVESIKLKK